MVTLISDKVARILETNNIYPTPVKLQVNMADGTASKISKVYEFKIKLNSLEQTIRALHLVNLTTPLVFGMDVLNTLDLSNILNRIQARKNTCQQDANLYSNMISDLSIEEEAELSEFLAHQLKLFDQVKGLTHLVEHQIRLKTDTAPIKQRYYPRNPAMQKVLNDEVDRMLTDDVIEPSCSPWSSPVVLIKKPSGKYRFCVDYRKVNQHSLKDAYPLPQINAILEKLRDAHYISTLDLRDGYWQVPLQKESRPTTAFTVPGRGLYQFKVMPFGLHSAPACFQRLLDTIIGPEFEPRAFAYLDDLVLVSRSFKEHLKLLEEVFSKLREAGLRLNPAKCYFCKKELKYLGHIVNQQGIQTDPEKLSAINQFPTPKTVRQVRSFLGLASWYRRFVPRFAVMSAPLTQLLRKNQRWNWTEKQEHAFQSLKDVLTSSPVLSCPDFAQPFILQVDASNDGLGASLTQKKDKNETVIAFASRLLSESERKFSVTEKECLSLIWAVKKFRPYLEGYKFVAITDHQALRWLMTLEKPSGRLARWMLELQQHDFTIEYRPGSQNRVADALSRYPNDQTNSANEGEVHLDVECHATEQANVSSNETVNKSTPNSTNWYVRLFEQVTNHPQRYPNYDVRGEKLYRFILNKKTTKDPATNWKLCVPLELREQVLVENHDHPTAGHFGVNKSVRRVSERYFWPKWRQEVREYVKQCDVCQRYKVDQKKPAGKMHFRKPVGPWYTVTSDLVGPLPKSRKGNRFLLVFQDSYTKWVEAAPLKNATARQVSQKFLELILLRYGAPEEILSDNGSQYTSKLFTNLAREWNVTHKFTAIYSPQSNPTERENRVLKTLISQYVRDDHRAWDEHLDEFKFAINTSVHDSTKFTPAMLNFCRELKIPKSTYGNIVENEVSREKPTTNLTHSSRLARMSELKRHCENNLKLAYQRQAKYYNLRRRDNPFSVGQTVLRRAHTLSSAADYIAGKLAPKFEGPFVLSSKIGVNIFRLHNTKGRYIGTAHVKDLKPYVRPHFEPSSDAMPASTHIYS